MRSLLVLAGLIVCFALTPAPLVLAQTPTAPAVAKVVDILTVVVPEAEVRAGPSEQFHVTTKLRAGARVEVVGMGQADKYPGWLAIRPPLGSFSWINGNFIQELTPDKKTGMVVAAEETLVPIYAGSTEVNKEPSVEIDKVARGTQVFILGSANFSSNKGKLVPIAPTPREVRYIRLDQVKKIDLPGGMTPDPRGQETSTKVSEAEQHLLLCRKKMEDAYNLTTDPIQKLDIQKKLAMLPILAGTTPPTSVNPNSNVNNPVFQTASTDANKVYNAGLAPTTATAPQWSAWGVLRKANFNKDGQQMYVLTSQQGEPLVYAIPVAGKSLESQVGRLVSLYGSSVYHSDYIRMNVMTVTHVSQP